MLLRVTMFIPLTVFSSPSEEEVTITRMLDKVLRRSDAVDKESLCILAGQRASPIATFGEPVADISLGVASQAHPSLPRRRRKPS